MKKLQTISAMALSLLIVGIGLLALGGCASTTATTGKGKRALVCPQCKMVEMTVDRPVLGSEYGGSYGSKRSKEKVFRDSCPGCQGVIKTVFVNGKQKFKCTYCQDTPFTCPVSHAIKG